MFGHKFINFKQLPKSMKLILVRHGETYLNSLKVHQGHWDAILSDKGRQQAIKVAERLRNEKIDVAYSSDLIRAVNTAEEILKFHKKAPHAKTMALREMDVGIFEGIYSNLIKEYVGNETYWDYQISRALSEVNEKVVGFLDEIMFKHKDETVLIVSHGGPIGCLLTYFSGNSIDKIREYLPHVNTAVSVVRHNNKGFSIEVINCANHLE